MYNLSEACPIQTYSLLLSFLFHTTCVPSFYSIQSCVCVCLCVIPHWKVVATTTTTTTIVWIHYNMVNRLKLKHTGTTVDGIEGIGKDKRQDSHQLHDNVEGRS